MTRSFEPIDLIALPRLSAISTARLFYELLRAANEEKKLPASIAADRDDLAHGHKALTVVLKQRLSAEGFEAPGVGAADRVEDTAFGALIDWLRAFARLPAERRAEAAVAKVLLQAIVPSGPGFLAIRPPDERQEVETRLRLIAEKGYDQTIRKLGGGPFLDELATAHKAYGKARGIPSVKPLLEPPAVREARGAAHEVLRAYVLRVSAYVRKADPQSAALASRLLSPLIHWNDRPNKAAESEGGPLSEAPIFAAALG